LPDFYVIPLSYYIFFIPGLIIAWFKKRFEIVFLSLLPVIGAFIAGGYDFRVLLAAGLFPSVRYIWTISQDPNSLWLLPHKDVAVSRLIQDIVLGVPNPSTKMKREEFNRKIDPTLITHDTMVCPLGAYAIMHLYLQNFDDKKILTFIDQGTQLLATPEEIFKLNTRAIANYIPTGKNLKLVWEVSDRSQTIINTFSRYNK